MKRAVIPSLRGKRSLRVQGQFRLWSKKDLVSKKKKKATSIIDCSKTKPKTQRLGAGAGEEFKTNLSHTIPHLKTTTTKTKQQ